MRFDEKLRISGLNGNNNKNGVNFQPVTGSLLRSQTENHDTYINTTIELKPVEERDKHKVKT